jgi:hypothetical protein
VDLLTCAPTLPSPVFAWTVNSFVRSLCRLGHVRARKLRRLIEFLIKTKYGMGFFCASPSITVFAHRLHTLCNRLGFALFAAAGSPSAALFLAKRRQSFSSGRVAMPRENM